MSDETNGQPPPTHPDFLKPNDPFDHDPDGHIARIDARLEEIDRQRVALKEEGRKLLAEKLDHHMREQITLRVLADSALSGNETRWIEDHPEDWDAIRAATKGKRGTRRRQQTTVK